MEQGYHGYWTTNFEEINENFGTEQDLKDLVNAAHARNIWVMVDVNVNHVAPIGSNYSQIYPLNQPTDYHRRCQITDWTDQFNVEYCRLDDQPDLDQYNGYVRSYLKDWVLRDIVYKFNFDGIRIGNIP